MIRIVDIYVGNWPRASVTVSYLYEGNVTSRRWHGNVTHSSLSRVRKLAWKMHEVAGGEDGSTAIQELPTAYRGDYPARPVVSRDHEEEVPF